MVLKALQPPCTWQDCGNPGTEVYHEHEREVFGRLAELGPKNWYCSFHHELITRIRNESYRGYVNTALEVDEQLRRSRDV